MDSYLKIALWREFGAVIDYLERALTAYPEHLWTYAMWPTGDAPPERSQVWYVAYHALFWLDLYLTGTEDGFLPPAPFLLIEQDEHGPIPERAYTQAELLDYLRGCRQRCRATIQALTDESAARQCSFSWGECSFYELQIYSLRHVQEHTAQLNLVLGQQGIPTADYPPQTRTPLE